jgi:hypothetical protein
VRRILGEVPQIFDRVKSVALWSAKKKEEKEKKRTIKGYGARATVYTDNLAIKTCISRRV